MLFFVPECESILQIAAVTVFSFSLHEIQLSFLVHVFVQHCFDVRVAVGLIDNDEISFLREHADEERWEESAVLAR